MTRFDNTDLCFDYEGKWEHNTMSSFKNYKRTISKGEEGSSLTVKFDGTGFALTGENAAGAVISVEIDGGEAMISGVYKTGSREITYHCEGLENGTHTAKITVAAGKFGIDGMEVIGGELPYPAKEEETAAETEPETKTYAEAETSEATAEENKKSPALPIAAAAAAVIAVGAGAAILIKKKK